MATAPGTAGSADVAGTAGSADAAGTADIAVVGGGVVGLTIAHRAAVAGLGRVVVLDPQVAREAPVQASWVAAGMLAPVTEVHYGEEPLLTLTLAASRRWPSYAEEVEQAAGRAIGYRRTGTVTAARDGDDRAALDKLAAYQEELGLQVTRLRSRELRALEPALGPRTRGGLLVEGDHSVDPRALVRALRVACERAGVGLAPAAVRSVADVRAGTVVVASGAATGRLLPDVPVRPVQGQILRLRGRPLLERTVRGLEVYLVPRADGRLVVGATVEERADRRVTAGAVHDLLHAAAELVPDVAELELVEATAGLRPGTPDNAPVLGRVDDRTVVASGHYRNGILLAPLTADLVVGLLATGRAPALMAPFDPARFSGRSACG